MISIDFTNIDNAVLVGRLLPHWARGKTVSLLLQAVLAPLATAHANFRAWALQRYVDCHITSQKASLEWYLGYRLSHRFRNPDDSFFITHGVTELLCCMSGSEWRNGLHWDNDARWDSGDDARLAMNLNLTCVNTGVWENGMYWNNSLTWENEDNGRKLDDDYLEVIGQTNVYAPAITETVNYSHDDYRRDIRQIMSKYMTNFKYTNIIINTE